MLSSYNPLTTVKQASVQLGLKVKELNKLIADKVVKTSHRGGNTLYVDNLSLATYIELNGGQVERYEEAVNEAVLKVKADSILEKANVLIKNEKKVLPLTYKAIYNEKISILDKALKKIIENLTTLSDEEYEQFLKNECGDIIDVSELRKLIYMAKKDTVVFSNPSNEELLKMGVIIKQFRKNNALQDKLNKLGFTNEKLGEYYEQDIATLKILNNEGVKFDIFTNENQAYIELFETYKNIKEEYNTKIEYSLDKSVIADIEAKFRKKFHISVGV